MQKLLPYIILFSGIVLVYIFIALKKYKRTKISVPGNWKTIKVDLDRCEVLPYEHLEGKDTQHFPSRTEIIDSLYGGSRKGTDTYKTVSIILYTHQFTDGKRKKYKSDLIYSDPVTIKHRLMNNKVEATLYLDPSNPDNYYFQTNL